MPQHNIVVIGGSAGSLQPLTDIITDLPANLTASVLVVMHTSSGANGYLPEVLRRWSKLPVGFAQHAAPIEPGHIYVAKPDLHLIVSTAGLRTVHGPRENGFRPAIDPLFRTAARQLGPRVVGIVLSGALSDGTYGLSLIKQHGGIAIVQDPGDAAFDSMPKNALNAVDVDYILPAAEIGPLIARLTQGRVDTQRARGEQAMASMDDD